MTDDGQVLVGKARGQLIGLKVDGIFVEIALDLLVLFTGHFYHLGFILVIHKIENSLFPLLDIPQKLLSSCCFSFKMKQDTLLVFTSLV